MRCTSTPCSSRCVANECLSRWMPPGLVMRARNLASVKAFWIAVAWSG